MRKIRLLNRLFSLRELWTLRRSFLRLGMRLFSFSRLGNLARLYVSRVSRSAHVSGLPYVAMIEPTSRCNLRCPMCGRTFAGLRRAERDMSIGEFTVVFNKIKFPLLAIGFWNLGEPLLNGDLFAMVRRASREKIFSVMLTNGTLLDRSKAGEMIESGLDYVGISMDGASVSSYNKYRRGGEFETVVENIRFLVAEKKRRRALNPFVEIVFLVMKDNEHEIDAMASLAKQLGVDKLSFKKVSLGFADEFLNPAEFLPAERRFIHAAHLDSVNSLKKFCFSPWIQVGVNADGNVVSCCGDYFSVPMGNLFVEGFSDVWNGARFKKFRTMLRRDIDAIDSCKLCAERSYDTDVFITM